MLKKDISKKIGILTFSDISNKNYGALLQTYALKKTLQNLGYEPEIINYKKQFNGSRLDELKYRLKNPTIIRRIEEKSFTQFAKIYLPERTIRIPYNQLSLLNSKYSTFIVGSDQVWRHKYTKNDGFTYYLDFVGENKKKISYAASFGKDSLNIENDETRSKIEALLKSFSAISVREQSGINICKKEFNIKARLVLDPTLLLKPEDYQNISKDFHFAPPSNNFIACMILDNSTYIDELCNKISNKKGKKIINITGNDFFIKQYVPFGSWLEHIKKSDTVVTDSFHCAVFAILFNKQFIVIKNKDRGLSRIENLLDIMGINRNRIIMDLVGYDQACSEVIRYDLVNNSLELWRQESLSYLESALSK
nr:polysaccharide pyruvyl transferase family protein [uncultured Desulfobacter sp.]